MITDIEELYRRYGPMVLRRCRWILKDEDLAVDAMQDVFVLLIRKKEKLRADYPSSLLYRIATNVCLNIIRDRKKLPETRDEDLLYSIAQAEDPYEATVDESALGKLFEGEKESTRVIATLHLVDGLTLEETARETGLSVSGVRKRLRQLQEKANVLKEKML